MFSASDLADWFDEWQDKQYEQQDDWLIQSQDLGNAHPVLVFCSWFGDRMATAPKRLQDSLVGSVVDVLRLGADIDTDSSWGIAKGAFINVTRLAVLAGPFGEAVGIGTRWAGMLGTAKLEVLTGKGLIGGPCRFVSVNNALSFVKGKRVQLFAPLGDLIKTVRPGKPGANMIDEILKHPSVAPLIKNAGVVWKDLGNLPTLEKAFAKAREVEGAVVVGVKWVDRFGKSHIHRLTLVKDALGNLKILDYSKGAEFRGFSSLREIAVARGGIWQGIENAVIRPGVLLFESSHIRFLEVTKDLFLVGLPVAMGLQWAKGKRLDESAAEIAKSIWQFLKSKLGLSAPPPPELPDLTTNPNEWTRTVLGKPPYWYTVKQGVPKEDWISSRAGKEYGDVLLWPLIFEATQEEERKAGQVKFVNQNKMWAGQKVFVPDISGIPADKKAAARKRGMDWKRVD